MLCYAIGGALLTTRFGLLHLFLRRLYAWSVGILAFPLVCWVAPWRTRLYSHMFRVWFKTSREPVWLTRASRYSDFIV